jgi:hypothetical protein
MLLAEETTGPTVLEDQGAEAEKVKDHGGLYSKDVGVTNSIV